MPFIPSPGATALVTEAQFALGLTQDTLGKMLGLSRRTVSRWTRHTSAPSAEHLHALARAVHPKDAALAAKLARAGGESLESLGIAKAIAGVPLPGTPPRPFPPTRLVVESVVCAAAEAMQASPAAVRGILRAAFARARALGLTVEEMDDALAEPAEPSPGRKR
jgi:DNA-binding XRE family transcriptional regulator